MLLNFQTHDSGLGSLGLELIVKFNVYCACELAVLVSNQVDLGHLCENTADAADLGLIIISWEVDDFNLAVQGLLSFLSALNDISLPQSLLHNAGAGCLFLVCVLRDEVFVATTKLGWCWNWPS